MQYIKKQENKLVTEKTTPQNRNEQEIPGYREVLNNIYDSFDAISITKNYILQLHKILYSHMNNPIAGKLKLFKTILVQHIQMVM